MRHKILLIDDEPRVLSGLARVLSEEPYEVLTAESGREALSILAKTNIDVMVADQDMPGMSGTELLSKVYVEHPDIVRIMLTGKATLEVAIQAINNGAITQLLTKPCDPKDLALAIHQALIQKDFKDEAGQLVARENKQIVALADVERKNPGISRVEQDEHGAIKIEFPDEEGIQSKC